MKPTITVSRREGRDHLPHEVYLTVTDSSVPTFRDTRLIAAFEDQADALSFASRKAIEHKAVVVVEGSALDATISPESGAA